MGKQCSGLTRQLDHFFSCFSLQCLYNSAKRCIQESPWERDTVSIEICAAHVYTGARVHLVTPRAGLLPAEREATLAVLPRTSSVSIFCPGGGGQCVLCGAHYRTDSTDSTHTQ